MSRKRQRVAETPLNVLWGQEEQRRSVLRSRKSFQNQFTPFRRTPCSRRLRVSTERSRSFHHNVPADLKELVGKSWTVYKATPLYSFSYKMSMLQNYARLLGKHIESEINKGVVIDAQDIPDAAEFTIHEKGLECNKWDSKAIQITLKTCSKKDGTRRPVLLALLASVGIEEELATATDNTFTVLPIVLVKGPVSLARLLHYWLEVQFDSTITLLKIPAINLHWMVAMWAGIVPENRPRPVTLIYSPPVEVRSLSSITLDVNSTDCKLLWDSIHNGGEEIVVSEVTAFINAIEAHFFSSFGIHLKAMHLVQIGTAIVALSSEGRLKLYAEDHIQEVLASLTQLACEHVLDI